MISTVGLPLPGVEVRIADEHGLAVPIDEIGVICDEKTVVSLPYINCGTADNGAIMTIGAPAGTTLVDVLSPAGTTYTVDGSQGLNITVPKQSAVVLVPQNQVVPLP